ncbi:AMP-binding protein [Rhodococcus sp. 114MFTsu3.1]|uniref:AMP-binding protein n=1 Tax=Rhodococcus sp. 114MFTsu3.1 TaxID=1172184 RepID=UPI00056D50E2|nr:AMP-binding protein [Rhodococcus sp. 114MFTsu3.1]
MEISHLLYRSALRHPNNPLWISLDRPPVTYTEGAARVSALANAILARTSQRSRVAILSTNRYEGLESFLATVTAGCAAVTLNPRGHQEDYRHALSDSEAVIVLCDAALAGRLVPLREDLTHVQHWVSFGGDVPGFDRFDDWLNSSVDRPNVLIEPDDPAWLFYTSGTTGKPKGAVETHRNLLAMTRHFLLELGPDLQPDDVMLHLAPISHGSCSVALPHLAIGAANAFPASLSFDPSAVLDTIAKLKVTATMLAPTMIRMLLDAPDVDQYDLSSLKSVVYGAAPMPVADLTRALEVFGPVFVQFYGQAEAAATITCLSKNEHRIDDEDCLRRLGSAGRETFSTRVRIVDPAGKEVPFGTVGEIIVRGELVMAGYWKRPEATADTIRDGWLHTGDAGYLDDCGYLFITDRIKDMIISGGSNIYAREVEEVLGRHPEVSQVAVIGVPDEKWGEVVAAVVVADDGATLTPESVIEFARKSMASYKKPHHVWIVDELPTSAYGKILKRELRKRFHSIAAG